MIGCVVALAAQPASADQITYSLGIANFSGYPAPFGSATVTWNTTTTATIEFDANSTALYQYLFGGTGSVAVNVNATSWSLGTVTGSNPTGFGPTSYSNGGSGNEDGFGSFNQQIKSGQNAYTDASTKIVFGLTDTSGTWANAASVLSPNGSGYVVAAHIYIAGNPASPTDAAFLTGFAVDGGSTSVPDGGSTVALLGVAMLGIGSVRRVFSKK